VIEKQKIVNEADDEINRISSMFEVSYAAAASLLKHFKWQSERLMEHYFENPEKILKEAGVDIKQDKLINNQESLTKSTIDIIKASNITECLICGDDFDMKRNNFSGLPLCKHVFCDDCWRGYLEVKVKGLFTRTLLCASI
jgi:ariadne-1